MQPSKHSLVSSNENDSEEEKEEVKGLSTPMPIRSNPVWRPQNEDSLTPKSDRVNGFKSHANTLQSHANINQIVNLTLSEGGDARKFSRRAGSQIFAKGKLQRQLSSLSSLFNQDILEAQMLRKKVNESIKSLSNKQQSLDFENWLKLLPLDTFDTTHLSQRQDLIERLQALIVYLRNYMQKLILTPEQKM